MATNPMSQPFVNLRSIPCEPTERPWILRPIMGSSPHLCERVDVTKTKTGSSPMENLQIWESKRKQRAYWTLFEMFGCKNICSFKRNVKRRPFSKRIVTEPRGAVDS